MLDENKYQAIWITTKSLVKVNQWFSENTTGREPVGAFWFGLILVVTTQPDGQTSWFPYSTEQFHNQFEWVEIHEHDFAPVIKKEEVHAV
jgi:hypothetical protein